MAWEHGPQIIMTFEAAADLSAKQYHFVEFSSGQVNACNALTDVPLGVLQNKPSAQGRPAEVLVMGVTKVNSDAALSQGDLIGPSADGQADARVIGTDTTHYVVGRMLEATSGAGVLGTAMINCLNPHRAA